MSRPKRCKVCREEFEPVRPMQKVCSPICASDLARAMREQKERAETRVKRERLKTRMQHLKEAQIAVNFFARVRDADLPCISCGIENPVQWHAGHYLSRGAHPELSLDPRNIHKQCSQCNNYLSGNQIEYRKGLIRRYGQEYVDWLEGPHEPAHTTIEDAKRIKAEYRQKTRDLIKQRELDGYQ